MKMRFLQDTGAGIYLPGSVSFDVSTDNVTWTSAGSVPALTASGKVNVWYTLSGLKLTGRYVRVTVPVNVWVFTDEVQVWGQSGTADSNVAQGRTYTVTATAPDPSQQAYEASYPDTGGVELTNGALAASTNYTDAGYAGWLRQGQRKIIVDLGQQDDIHSIKMHFLQNTGAGIKFPEWVTYEVSADGLTWTAAGTVPTSIPTNQSGTYLQWFTQSGLNLVARYVRITVPVDVWVFADEIQVWGWPGSDANLALNRTYTKADTFPDELFASQEASYPDTNGTELTNGVLGAASYSDAAWQGWLRQDKRRAVVDLGQTSTVQSVSIHFLQNNSAGIRFPEYISFEISSDNVNWLSLGTAQPTIPLYQSGSVVQWYTLAGVKAAGRYLRATVPTGVYAFADEIQVWGGIIAGATQAGGVPDDNTDIGYPPPGTARSSGASHQMLIYTGYYPTNQPLVEWGPEHFRRYVGYVNSGGTITDTMFDSFLFMPVTSAAPSGNNYRESGTPSNQEDWQYILDRYSATGLQIDALNTAAAEVRSATGQSSFTPVVFISIPYPSPDQTAWGDANGDGVVNTQDSFGAGVDTTTALNNRVAAVRWYVDQAVSRFNSGGYSNLRLGGFYWLPESIPFNRSPNELAVVSGAAGVVHGYAGLTFEWIPFFHNEGFRHWSDSGFDVALMQPSYMFSTAPPARIQFHLITNTSATPPPYPNGTGWVWRWNSRSGSSPTLPSGPSTTST